MTVRDLIEILEEMPADLPVVVDGSEVDQVLLRDEIYYSADLGYQDGEIIKIM